MVAITIMAMLSSFGIASFVSYSRSQALQSATQDFVTTLQQAKSSASSQVKPDTCTSTGSLDGYQVIKNSEDSYTMGPICGGTLDTSASKIVTFSPASNIAFFSADDLTMTFRTVTADVTFDPSQPEDYVEIILQETQSQKIKTVRIYTDGRINVQ